MRRTVGILLFPKTGFFRNFSLEKNSDFSAKSFF